MKNKDQDNEPLMPKQIVQKINEYKINAEGLGIILRLFDQGFPITDAKLREIAKHYYMTKEILAQKIREYNLSQETIDILYRHIDNGFHLSEITDDLLERLGEYGDEGAPELKFFSESIKVKRHGN
jgi:hypothetical protein